MELRGMQPRDLPAVRELSRQLGYENTFEEISRRYEMIRERKDHHQCVAVDENNTVRGFMHIFVFCALHEPLYAKLKSLVVEEKFRGRGVGRLLVTEALRWARTRGIERISLESQAFRADTHRFYRNLGFSETREYYRFERHVAGGKDDC